MAMSTTAIPRRKRQSSFHLFSLITMIQRKQSVYLLLAFLATAVCLYFPLGSIELEGMGVEPVLYNMALIEPVGNDVQYNFSYIPLFVILAVATILELVTIFLYKNRRRQSRLCTLNLFLLFAWLLLFAYYRYFVLNAKGDFLMSWTSILPFVAAVFTYLAYKGIQADERLVRAADRIR